jgi:hypothetical protein
MQYFYRKEKSHVGNAVYIVYEREKDYTGFFPGRKCVGVYRLWEKKEMKDDFPGVKEYRQKQQED